ncbi:hypothetical protein [Clostridium massiliamazoniense]|uniref:hypothetical protein n=1 Tax=Clostridium massiliamazoniense TaxID=1347366 RepID=UPI0006D7FE41|nr:hypothetical protein [Clostridium massiliamazoniense]
MLNKDKNSRKKKSTRQEEIVKRTKKSSNTKSSVVSSNKATKTRERDKGLDKKNTKNVSKKAVKEVPKKKKVKKTKKELSPRQIKVRNILIGILTIIIIGGLCTLAVIESKKQEVTKNNVQQNKQTLDGLTDEQLITAANAYMGNTSYNFKSVLSKTKQSNGDLVATLMATNENNGTYNTTKVNVTYEIASGEPLAINEQEVGKETQTKSAIENSTQVQNKLDVTYKVLDYLEGTGMQINDTNWAMDIYENRTVDGQTGYLIDVYKIQGSVSNSIKWIFVTNSGQMYNAGQNGKGPLQPLQ